MRADRWDALRWQWQNSSLRRVRTCRRVRFAAAVTLSAGEHGGRLDGLVRCASPWSCPVCSASIQAGRSEELADAIEAHCDAGGHVAMLTLTMRHNASQSLTELWDALSPSWNVATAQNTSVRRAREQAGVLGFARTVEATYGANGWHLHIHALVFIKPTDPIGLRRGVDSLDDAIATGWMRALEKRGMPTPSREHGCELRLLDMKSARAEVARYVAKSAFTSERAAAAAALEVTATQTKAAGYGNRTPWQLLAAAIAGDTRAAALWSEWEISSRGRRCHTWSRGLREALALDAQEPDDEALTEEPEPQPPTPMLRFHPPAWDRWITKTAVIPQLLTAADTTNTAAAIQALNDLPDRPPHGSIEQWHPDTATWAPVRLDRPALPPGHAEQTMRPHIPDPRNDVGGVWSHRAAQAKAPAGQADRAQAPTSPTYKPQYTQPNTQTRAPRPAHWTRSKTRIG